MATTTKQFQVFKDAVDSHMSKLLPDWDYQVETADTKTADAMVSYQIDTYTAVVSLSDNLPKDYLVSDLKKIAYHEALHLLLAGVTSLAEEGSRSQKMDKAEHNIINRLCNVIHK